MSTAVVIATYNEAESIGGILEALRDYTVYVVDDSSPDGTADIVRGYAHAHLILRPGKLGIASAYADGFRAALAAQPEHEYIVQMDAGGTHPVSAIPLMLEYADMGWGLVIGARAFTWRNYRTAISLGAAWLMRRLGIRVHDATSGFRLWQRGYLSYAMALTCAEGFAFQLEMLWYAVQAGAQVAEVPITYVLTNSTFRFSMLREALRVYMRLARMTYL